MRKTLALSMAVMLLGISSGCGPSESSRDVRKTEAEKQQALRDSTFGSMAEAMDRARSVEQLQLDRKDRLEAALEDSGNR
ncbi:MAG: hypothetical protein E2O51_01500 [Gammaproteobacteria bacterium]|nr:MAG: hypothetical protein E2O51_01500 [Gammaproteobacteria bacterium]